MEHFCPIVLCNSVSAQPLVRRIHMEYTHLALGHGACRTDLEPALGWHIKLLWYSVNTIVCVMASSSWQLAV